jgi:hypothetical protein
MYFFGNGLCQFGFFRFVFLLRRGLLVGGCQLALWWLCGVIFVGTFIEGDCQIGHLSYPLRDAYSILHLAAKLD